MKKIVALTLALLMALQAVVLVSAEEAYVEEAEASPEVVAEATESVDTSEDTSTDDMVVVEEEGVQPEATEEETIGDLQEKALYGAYPLPADGKDVVGKVSTMVPTQAYVVTVPQTGVLTLVFNPTNQMKISILDEAMTVAYVNEQVVAPGAVTFNKHLNPGIYTIVVYRDNAETETAYTLNATHKPAGAAISGTSVLSPYELVFGADYASGAITETSSENWLLVRTAAAGKVTFETKTYEAGFSLEISKTSAPFSFLPATALKAGTPNVPESDLFSYYLEPGAYFIKVSNAGNKGIYDIRASFTAVSSNDVEPNNGIGVAQPINLGTKVRGILSLTDEIDVYSIMVNKPTDVLVQVSDYTEGLLVNMNSWLNPANMVPTLSKAASLGNETNPEVRQERVRLEPNVMYYIAVSRNAGIRSGFYDLIIQTGMTVETVSASPAGGALGVTLTLSAITSEPAAMYVFEPIWFNTVTNVWENPEYPGFRLYSTTPSVTYKPTKKGTYVIQCYVYDGYRWFKGSSQGIVISDPTVVTQVFVPSNVFVHGTPIPVTIQTMNAKPELYALDIISRATNSVVGERKFSKTNQFSITVPKAGKYVLQGLAYDGVQWSWAYSIEFEVFSGLKLLTLTADRTSAMVTDPIKYKLTTNGEPMMMTCYIYSIGATEVFRQFRSGNDMYTNTYTCPYLGDLNVRVQAYDGDKWHEIVGPTVHITSDVVTVSGLKKNFTDGFVGQSLTFSIDGTGTPAMTHYMVFNSFGGVVASSNARSNTFTTTINAPGNYMCRLTYTNNGVTQTVDSGWFAVSKRAEVYNLIVSPSRVRVNTPVAYNALVRGSTLRAMKVCTYYVDALSILRTAGEQVVTGSASTVFTPTQPGTYAVVVYTDAGDGIDYTKPYAFYNL